VVVSRGSKSQLAFVPGYSFATSRCRPEVRERPSLDVE